VGHGGYRVPCSAASGGKNFGVFGRELKVAFWENCGEGLVVEFGSLESVASSGLFGTKLSKCYASGNVLICKCSYGHEREGASRNADR
jgi:hypothetical protein